MRIYLYVILSFFLRMPAFAPIERELERTLMEKVAGLEFAGIKITATRWSFLLGRIRRLSVELRGIVISGLRVEMLSAIGEDIHLFPWLTYILDKPKLRSAGEIFWSLTISAEDLEKFLAGKGPLLRGTKVTIDDERITLSRGHGLAGALFDIREPLSLAGKLEVRPDSNIHLDLHQLKAFGISPGRVLVQPLLALINPIVRSADLNRMLKKVSIDMLEGFTLHNRFREIKLSPGFAEIHSEMFALKRKPGNGANGNRGGQNGD